jgi:hypothetical protein
MPTGDPPKVNVFCGTVTVDGHAPPDGTHVRTFIGLCNGDTTLGGDSLVTDGHYAVAAPADQHPDGAEGSHGCPLNTIHFGVGDRWANETTLADRSTVTNRLDLSVTSPAQVPRPTDQARRLDPRLLFEAGRCPNADAAPAIGGKIFEQLYRESTVRFTSDTAGISGVEVTVPELGLSGETDFEGCYVLTGFSVPEPRLITIVAERDGFGSHVTKNFILRSDEDVFPGASGEMRRDGILTVSDLCYYPYPPAAAGEAYRAEECRQMGALPPFLARNCEHPGVRRQSAFDPNLRVLTGVVNDLETGAGIVGATVEILEYERFARTTDNGCYNFGEFQTTGVERVTVTVFAEGYEGLTLTNFLLGSLSAHDVELRRGSGATTEDYCRLGPPKNQTWVARENICRRDGLLQYEGTR